MKVPYVAYEVEPSPTVPAGVVYRPQVILRVIGAAGDAYFLALVDTGADETLLPRSFGELVGVAIDDTQRSSAVGVAGQEIEVAPGTVDLELEWEGEQHRWSATVGFVEVAEPDEEFAILGHAGCLNYFVATFDGDNRELELVPTGSLA